LNLKLISPLIIILVFFVAVSGVQGQEGTMEKAGKMIEEGLGAAKDPAAKAEEKPGEAKDSAVKAEEKTEMDKIKEGMGKVKEGMDMGK
jgi:hypothetical protein